MGIIGSSKPWEVAVGKAISCLAISEAAFQEGKMLNYLGKKVAENLLSGASA
jgi:hypothetical protein